MIRALPITCASVIKLNYVEPPKPVVEDRPPTADPKDTKAPAKGKKK